MPNRNTIIMNFKGISSKIMCEINEKHRRNIKYENGQKVLYLGYLRTIYGCIDSRLQLYLIYKGTLDKEVLKVNKYDICIANKIING